MTVQEALHIATKEIGTKENPANSNCVKYNTWFYGHPVQDGIPKGTTYPWCATFISWIFRFNQHLCPKTASCLNMLDWFEKNKQTVKTPQSGDIVFFKYNTNKRRTNHVGIVESVQGNAITTIEGNTSMKGSQDNGGCVLRKVHTSNIVAYARPKYDSSDTSQVSKSLEEIALEVINGEWGTGAIRRQRLTQAGYNYSYIQALVNKMLKG